MSRRVKERGGPRQNFDTLYPEVIKEVFADGIAEVMIGVPICKLTLYQTRPAEPSEQTKGPLGVENREAVMILSMPTAVLIESFINVLKAFGANHSALQAAIDQNQAALLRQLERILQSGNNQDPTSSPRPEEARSAIKREPRR